MNNTDIRKAIASIREFTARACMNNPESYAPVAAKSGISILEDMLT